MRAKVLGMKIGLVTYKPEFVEGFDVHVYFSKWVDGQVFPAAKGMQNDVTVFCDAANNMKGAGWIGHSGALKPSQNS